MAPPSHERTGGASRGLAISCGQERSVERFETALALLQGHYVDFRAALILTTTLLMVKSQRLNILH
jgi:hypothetical protein